jgi:hypothetical protein
MNIKEFTLGAIKWTIKIDNKRLNDLDNWGLCEYAKSLISLCDNNINEDLVEQTFCHELVHAILYSMGENELCHNERFVQKFSLLLHQFEKTKK